MVEMSKRADLHDWDELWFFSHHRRYLLFEDTNCKTKDINVLKDPRKSSGFDFCFFPFRFNRENKYLIIY